MKLDEMIEKLEKLQEMQTAQVHLVERLAPLAVSNQYGQDTDAYETVKRISSSTKILSDKIHVALQEI